MDTDSVGTPRNRFRTAIQEGHRRRVGWTHLPLTLAALTVMLVAVWLREDHSENPGTALLTFTALQWLPLLFRTSWPVPVFGATLAASAAQLIFIPQLDHDWESAVGMAVYQPVPVAVMVAAFNLGIHASRRTAWIAGGTAAAVLPLLALITHPATEYLWTNLVMANLVLDGTAVGVLIAARRERMARERQERAEQARRDVEAERLRIAQELHDVLAHHLTLVNAQASVADYLIRSNPAAAADALHGLAKHTRQALDEVRATVGLLRQHPDPADTISGGSAAISASDTSAPPLPTLDQLPQLIATVRGAGTIVELQTHGLRRALSPGGELASYRLVQEALTNATKHAPDAPVTVTMDWEAHHLRIQVHNPAPTTNRPTYQLRSGGHGLVGMAERVKAAGGTLDLERPDGGFTVTAVLPIEPATPAVSLTSPDPMESP